MTSFREELIRGFWQYVRSRPGLANSLERTDESARPPVFKRECADFNLIRTLDEQSMQSEIMLRMIQKEKRHQWFRSMASSQALVQSLFGNLKAHGQLALLRDVETDSGEALVGQSLVDARLEFDVNWLGEPRKSNLDVLLNCARGYRVALECKLTEVEIGKCSRPGLTLEKDKNYKQDHCDGTYTLQRGRKHRCSLVRVGVEYWDHIPSVFEWSADEDHIPCPLYRPYQLVRNVLAVSVGEDGRLRPAEDGHAVLVYDERNPAFAAEGNGHEAYERTRSALKQPARLRKCSWQTIVRHLRKREALPWMVEELHLKYGF